jgi:hypothetical protein
LRHGDPAAVGTGVGRPETPENAGPAPCPDGATAAAVPPFESEKWEEFAGDDLALRLAFPKTPTVTVNNYQEAGAAVKSSIVQSYINQVYYMVEVREYPENFLPERNDLGTEYGQWLKRFILSGNTIVAEKTVDFGQFKLVEFIYQQSGSEVVIHRALVAGRKLYQVIVQLEIKKNETIDETIAKNREKIDRFFLSFEITDGEVSDTTNG